MEALLHRRLAVRYVSEIRGRRFRTHRRCDFDEDLAGLGCRDWTGAALKALADFIDEEGFLCFG